MSMNNADGSAEWTDPDDAPELTEEMLDRGDWYAGDKLIRRGRPKSDNPKQQISIRLDADLLARLRALGPGWQGQVNDMLRQALDRPSLDRPR